MSRNTVGPPDGGWGWMCVIGKLCCYFCVLGTASAFGIIYIDLIDYYNTTREETAWIGSLSVGITFLTGPFSSILTSRFGIQKTIAAGTLIAFSGCFISYFATGIPYLYVSYGVVMGIGLGVIFVPSILIVAEYFQARIGIANAIGSAGNGLGTVVLPPLYTYLLEQYGWRGTVLLLSGIILHGFVCAVIFIPPPYRLSPTKRSSRLSCTSTPFTNFSRFLHSPILMLYTFGTALGYFGYTVPFVHLPDLAVLIGIEKYQAAYLITIMGVSNVFGRLFFGWISDFPCVNVIFLQGFSLMMCGVVTAVCPHLTEFYALACYSVIFGIFIGVFASIISVVVLYLVGLDLTGDFMGMLFFVVGFILTSSSPVAGWLFDTTKTYNASFYVTGSACFLSGVLVTMVMVLHNRQRKTDVPLENVSQLHVTTQQDSQNQRSLEQTHM